ncbi:hypothetical protein SAMN06269117_1432 [Balnearium lithotrophicum]|uniref:UBA domain-containing protein n=1 Tax=Balnearium lithotrophicum TaxID=223788 RepID=A0A521EJ96_9BACT|nr:helix-turn-helix domain-containing protein [Balnearium lithotrophicum]SMO83985.1 hypothetical protein SAMN06269117_1432 [Balnearium lithotrophicum]
MNKNFEFQRANSLQEEFEAKNDILSSKFLELSSEEYFNEIFSDKNENDDVVIVLGTLKDKKGNVLESGTIIRVKAEDIWKITWRSNAYIPYCDFRRNYYHSKTLERVRAFVVDCDGVTSSRLRKILRYLWSTLPAEPTHIVNSGKGVHFVYLLSEPAEVKGLRWSVNSLNRAIQEKFSSILDVDKHPVVHPYRFPGFLTKINTTARGFRVREPYNLEELMKLFEIKPKKEKKKQEKNSKKKAKLLVLPNGRRAFFEWVLRKLFFNPPILGRRQNSFFALGIVSYKCRREVPYEEAVETIEMVYEDMMDRNLHIGFDIQEAYEAFHKGYNPKYVRASWKYLCSLFGWEYRPNKRNGRTREEHLRLARKIRSIYAEERKKEKEEHIKRLISKGYSKSEIAEMLGISRRNLYKTYGYLFK